MKGCSNCKKGVILCVFHRSVSYFKTRFTSEKDCFLKNKIMEKLFDILLKNRKILHDHLQNTPKEDLFRIPKGFNNNIWWNIAHVVVTPQLLLYGLSGLDFTIEKELIDKYRKGTFPDGEPSKLEMEKISAYLFSTVKLIQLDYSHGKFKTFKEYMTSPKIGLASAEDTIAFNVFHEGLHLGAIGALKKALELDR